MPEWPDALRLHKSDAICHAVNRSCQSVPHAPLARAINKCFISKMTKRIILAGGGHAHLAVLADWAMRPLAGTQRKLVTSSRHTAYSGMLPGWLAGMYHQDELMIDLEPLARKAGADLVITDIVAMDADARMIELSSGARMEFDILSLATGGQTHAAPLVALGDKLLPVKPVDGFISRWSAFATQAGQRGKADVIVVGGGAAGVELAFGIDAALRRCNVQSRVSLVTSETGFLAGHAAKTRTLVSRAFAQRGIALHFARGAATADGLALSDGTFLRADCVVAATGSRAQPWLARSGLACSETGFVLTGANLRSISHPCILAAGDVIERVDLKLERSGVHAVKAGPVLAANIRASLDGHNEQTYKPRRRTLYLLAQGNRRAIFSRGPIVTAGKWVWWLKDRIDLSFVQRYKANMQ
jgi:pyridine nucleotide-disulfide oxidoreductase family protein